MNLWFRFIRMLILSFFRPRLAFAETSRLRFRVWPTDLDINVHMNNARYLAIMDIGRLDMIVRGGMWRPVLHDKLQPVIAGCMVRFRRSLRPFQHFELKSRVVGWDKKWLFIEHRVESDGELYCHAIVKGMLLGRDGGLPPQELAEKLGHDGPSPPLPAWLGEWLAAEGAMAQPPLQPVEEACVR